MLHLKMLLSVFSFITKHTRAWNSADWLPSMHFSTTPAQSQLPAVHKILMSLQDLGHIFAVKGDNVKILATPEDFFDAMMTGVSGAKKRLTIASLYIGTGGGRCDSFVCNLGEAASDVAGKPDLKISLLMDGSRGTRPSLDPSGLPTSSAEHLRKSVFKVKQPEGRTRISLYQTPALQGILKQVLPPRVREVVSVCHLKVYLFDEDVLLTGANLSNDYFNHRQDRYILIKNTKQLADKMDELVQAMSDFSLELMPTGYLKPPPSGIHPIKQPIKFREGIWNRITQVMYPSDSPLYNWWSPFNSDTDDHRDATFMDSVSDTWVVPLVQFAHCHIRQDEVCIINCFRSMKAGGLLQLASAYLNLAVPFKRELMRAPTVNLEIFTASPEANGFFGAKGISGFVPKAYSLVMSQIWKQLCSRDQGSDAGPHRQILEYRRDTWQFHAKGIWYTPPRESFPVMTAVGSPNFGHRSVYRDIESQVLLFTANPDLQKRLQVEAQSLLEHCHPVQEEKIVELRRQTGAAVKLAVKLVKGFL